MASDDPTQTPEFLGGQAVYDQIVAGTLSTPVTQALDDVATVARIAEASE